MNYLVPKPTLDKFADLLGSIGLDTDGPGWGPATISQLGVFSDAAEAGQVQVALADAPVPVAVLTPPASSFAEALATVAESQIGTQEDAAHSNRGSAILKYQQATSLGGQGWPWCAAFDDWCYETASAQVSAPYPRPQTASAFGEIDWAQSVGAKVFGPGGGTPRRGDIVVYTFSHTGIVTGYTGGESFSAVEGNTNDQGGSDGYEVARRTRNFGAVKAFIRLA